MEAFNRERAYRLSARALRLFEPSWAADSTVPNALIKTIADLSMRFTRERERIGARYLDDPANRAGYAAYFLPVNFAKVQMLLSELPTGWADRSPISVLDVGSGPGTASIAVLDWLVSRGRHEPRALHVSAIDQSNEALMQASRIWNAYGPGALTGGATLTTIAAQLETIARRDRRNAILDQAPWDLIIVANSLNELFRASSDPAAERASLLERLLAALKPEGTLIIVEPALRSTARELHRTRDLLLDQGLCTVYSPCLHDLHCPALAKADDWCHEERPWDPPQWIAGLDRDLGFIKDALKFSYLLLRKDGLAIVHRTADRYRVVSELRVFKGEKRAWLCNELGRSEVGRLDRKATSSNAPFDAFHRGAIVQIDRIMRKDRGGTVSALGRIAEDGAVKIVRGA